MGWVVFVAGAVLSWGAYGALLHQGQTQLGNPLKALLCVGVAYFLIGVIVPVAGLSSQNSLSGFDTGGLVTATIEPSKEPGLLPPGRARVFEVGQARAEPLFASVSNRSAFPVGQPRSGRCQIRTAVAVSGHVGCGMAQPLGDADRRQSDDRAEDEPEADTTHIPSVSIAPAARKCRILPAVP